MFIGPQRDLLLKLCFYLWWFVSRPKQMVVFVLLGLNMDTINDSQASVFNSVCQTDNWYLVVNIWPMRFVHDNM